MIQDNGVDNSWTGGGQATSKDLGEYARPRNIWLPATVAGNGIPVPALQLHKPFIVVAHDVTAEQVEQLQQIGEAYRDDQITSLVAHETPHPDGTTRYELFFVRKESNKKYALQLVSELSRISIENIMATGDGPNDTVIVEHAGVGVAMGNGVDATKAVATWIAPRREHDGARVALQQLVLKN